MSTIKITRHNAGNPVIVGNIVIAGIVTEGEIEMTLFHGHIHDLMEYAEEGSTIPEGYEWSGDECYEIMPATNGDLLHAYMDESEPTAEDLASDALLGRQLKSEMRRSSSLSDRRLRSNARHGR